MEKMSAALCNPLEFAPAQFLVFGENVAPLIYYSHLPIILLSIILGSFIFIKNRHALANQILFFTVVAFALWVFLDSIFWASNRSDVIMLVWSLIVLIEPLIYIGCLYLAHVLINNKDMEFGKKMVLALLYLPFIIFVPTHFTLSAFDTSSCLAEEGPIALYYSYIVEAMVTLWIIAFSLVQYRQSRSKQERQKILLLLLGIILFLVAFAWGNITGSFTDNWELGQYGLFGMPIFIGFLVYSIVKFKTFDIKLVGSFALVSAVAVLNFALIFLRDISTFRGVTLITFVFTIIFGIFLIRSVLREIKLREKMTKLAIDLEIANNDLHRLDIAKSDFISIASHQLRTPLSTIKGYISMVQEGTFGPLSPKLKDPLHKVYLSNERLITLVSDLLDLSRMERGKMQYDFRLVKLSEVAQSIVNDFKIVAKAKKMEIHYRRGHGSDEVNGDANKLRQVVLNLIDNAFKYTASGSVTVLLAGHGKNINLAVTDTGVGLDEAEIRALFQKFSRGAEQGRSHTEGLGLGLYVARLIAEAHGGELLVSSPGKGKGSTFTLTLPIAS